MEKEQFDVIENWYFNIKRSYDEGGISNPQMKIWNEIYESACALIIRYKV